MESKGLTREMGIKNQKKQYGILRNVCNLKKEGEISFSSTCENQKTNWK